MRGNLCGYSGCNGILTHGKTTVNGFSIDKEDRIVYAVEEDTVVIISCKGHYNDQ